MTNGTVRTPRGVGHLLRGDAGAALANLGWLAAERLTQVGVAIVTSGILARYFGPDVFGKWQYANTLLTVAAPLTWVCGAEILVPAMVAAGTRADASRNGARRDPDPNPDPDRTHSAAASGTAAEDAHSSGQRRDHTAPPGGKKYALDSAVGAARLDTIMGSAFALRMAVALAALALVWSVLGAGRALGRAQGPFDPIVAAMLAGLTLTLVFREPFGVVSAWLQARTYSKPALLLTLCSALAKACAVFLLARAALPPGGFGGIWAVESAVIGIGLLLYQRRHAGFRWRVDRALLRHFATAGSVFWLGLVCMYLFMKLDRLMLQHYVGFAELGRYAAAQQLNENWITLALMLAQTVAPAFVYRVADPARLRRNLFRLLALTGTTMALGAVLIGICAPFIIRLVFGPGFDNAVAFLRWAAWLSVLAGLEAICNLIILKYQARYVVLAKWAAALGAAFLANLLLIPAFGGFGALAGLAIGYGVALAVDAVYIHRALSVNPS